mmetsp:Transcript_6472/g.20377  ORF Transcript_6472/g.20377 Transcript_6472/m.20377 type:complete len:98 (+) Transcript_6472:1012-1305(+)
MHVAPSRPLSDDTKSEFAISGCISDLICEDILSYFKLVGDSSMIFPRDCDHYSPTIIFILQNVLVVAIQSPGGRRVRWAWGYQFVNFNPNRLGPAVR